MTNQLTERERGRLDVLFATNLKSGPDRVIEGVPRPGLSRVLLGNCYWVVAGLWLGAFLQRGQSSSSSNSLSSLLAAGSGRRAVQVA